jgi:hypothetical protein
VYTQLDEMAPILVRAQGKAWVALCSYGLSKKTREERVEFVAIQWAHHAAAVGRLAIISCTPARDQDARLPRPVAPQLRRERHGAV